MLKKQSTNYSDSSMTPYIDFNEEENIHSFAKIKEKPYQDHEINRTPGFGSKNKDI